jgi:hypothetical protein
MVEFSKIGQQREKAKNVRELGASELLDYFKSNSELQQHLVRARKIIALRNDPERASRKKDDEDLDKIVREIQGVVNSLSSSYADQKISRDDVERYLNENKE